jgi:radical SAM superfamily enzyme YgiQ (UPF0313 family)
MNAVIVYEQPLYRPPSEARSLILQATLGCSYNKCAFCVSFQNKKFRLRPLDELFSEIDWASKNLANTRRVFLADGDAMAMRPDRMIKILNKLYAKLPRLERVTAYAGPGNFRHLNLEQLKQVRQAGLSMLYFGLESGDDEVLRRIRKGFSCQEMVAACLLAQQAGFDLSLTVVLGLAGAKASNRHAQATGRAISQIKPRYASALTLMIEPRKPSYTECYNDPDWHPLNALESLHECRTIIENIRADHIIFRSNHASNYVALKGVLQRDKAEMLNTIDEALANPASSLLRPEWMRGL